MILRSSTAGAFFALALAACSASAGDGTAADVVGVEVPVGGGGSYVDILPTELEAMLARQDFLLVNVHVPNEGEIPGTDLHLPFDQIGQHTAELPVSKQAPIVLYCRSGSMSAIAARELVGLGYSQIYNLDGGFRAWTEAGFEFNR